MCLAHCGGQRTNSGVGLKLLLLEIGSLIGLQLYHGGQTRERQGSACVSSHPTNGGDYRCVPVFFAKVLGLLTQVFTPVRPTLLTEPSPQSERLRHEVGSFTLAVSNNTETGSELTGADDCLKVTGEPEARIPSICLQQRDQLDGSRRDKAPGWAAPIP